MGFLKKNKKAQCPNCDKTFDTEEERNKHFKDEHDKPIEETPANAPKKYEETTEITSEQLVSINTEAWYKAKVLEQLITINENLAMLIEVANGEPNKENNK